MYDHLELAYLGIEVPDPSSLDAFFGDVVGLVPGDAGRATTHTWRDDAKAHRLIVEAGTPTTPFVGFEATDDAAFDAVADSSGRPASSSPRRQRDECAARGVARLVRTTAPWGVARRARPRTRPTRRRRSRRRWCRAASSPTASASGTSCSPRPPSTSRTRSLTDGLGLAQSDWLEMELAPGIELEVRFYHCNARHHTLALAQAPFELPQRCTT